jgi:protein-tyrosine phosphatase
VSLRYSSIRLPNGAVLAIGGRPPPGGAVAAAGFKVLVLTADTYQPLPPRFPGVYVVNAPLADSRLPLTSTERGAALRASRIVAKMLGAGQNVLVTCEMGLNRSAYVSALALVRLGWARPRAIALVRQMRFGGLNNSQFVRLIEQERVTAD